MKRNEKVAALPVSLGEISVLRKLIHYILY